MDAKKYARMEEMFAACCDLPAKERDAYLDEACGDDAELREAVEQLLIDDAGGESFLDGARAGAAAVAASALSPSDESADHPERIGPYRVVRKLGAGGMGIVYLAEQDHPRRSVAVKVLRPGAISADALRRFSLEAQVLGQLQHPGIAHIYEARTTGSGRDRLSYFAMEYVDGVPLSEYVRTHELGTRASLELIARVCDAVHHAHQKGVIHRDLKPGNILVDASGQPKILDFGVARATDADVQTVTLQTDVGQLIGTIPYMSPEQVTGSSSELDIRSDVYALGVITFELLAGKLPHDLRHRSVPEAARMIREDEPLALSSVNPQFRGDVQTIVAKALEKEKDRRYASAAELAEDIRRYLRDEPITARPASTSYQLRKFARRNRALVGGVCATFVAVVVGLITSLVLYVQADLSRRTALEQREIAESEADRANAINDFLLQDMLAAPDPWSEQGKDVTVARVLDDAASRVDEAFANQPAVEAQVRATLGGSFLARGLFDDAAEQLERSVELYRSLATAGSGGEAANDRLPVVIADYAEALERSGDIDRALAAAREAVDLAERRFGDGDARTADALFALGQVERTATNFAEARAVMERCIAIRRDASPRQARKLAMATSSLGSLLLRQALRSEAEPVLQEARKLFVEAFGAHHPYVAQVQIELGSLDYEEGRYAEAIKHVTPACEILRERLGAEHAETMSCVRTLALAQHKNKEYDAATAAIRSLVATSERTLGENHPETMAAVNSLAYMYLDQGDAARAIPLYERLLADARAKLGESHLETLRYAANLSWCYRNTGRLTEAEALFRNTARIQRESYGMEQEDARFTTHSLALLQQELGHWDECFENFRIITDACRRDDIECGWRRGYYLNGFGDALLAAEAYEEAVSVLREGLEVCREMFAPGDWRLADTRGKLGFAMAMSDRDAAAIAFITETYRIVASAQAAPPATKQLAYDRLVEGLTALGQADRAREFSPPAPARTNENASEGS